MDSNRMQWISRSPSWNGEGSSKSTGNTNALPVPVSSSARDVEDPELLHKGIASGRNAETTAAAPAVAAEVEYMSVDDILVKHVGEFGWGQFWHFVLVSLAWILQAMHSMVMIFGDRVPEWHCVPQHSSPSLMYSTGGGTYYTGNSNSTSSSSTEGMTCSASSSLCGLPPGAWEWTRGKGYSTVSQWNLICGDEYKSGLAASFFFVGVLCGTGTYGGLSDSFLGRKGTLALACMTTVLLGLLTSLAPLYWVYVALRFATGFNNGGIGLCSFVLATEIVGPHKRGQVGMSAFYFFSSGMMLLPLFGYLSPNWRILYVATAMPGLAYCVLVLPFIWESPRWYLVKGRLEDAMNVLRAFAKRNGRSLPESVHLRLNCDDDKAGGGEEVASGAGEREDVTTHFKKNVPPSSGSPISKHQVADEEAPLIDINKAEGGAQEPQKSGEETVKQRQQEQQAAGTLVGVFKYKETRRRMLIMICIFWSGGVVYYGISLNVVNLGFNLYVSVFVNGLIEFPAFAITASLLGKVGRKVMLISTMALSGVCCLLGSVVFLVGSHGGGGLKSAYGFSSAGGEARASSSSQISFRRFDEIGGGNDDSGMEMGVLRLLCGVAGIFGMAGAYNLIYIYTAELFPTVVRNAALGLAAQAAGIGSIIAPFIVVIGHFAPSLPYLMFGVLALAGAGLSSFLPETLNQPLHETLEGMERTGSKPQTREEEEADAEQPSVQGITNAETNV